MSDSMDKSIESNEFFSECSIKKEIEEDQSIRESIHKEQEKEEAKFKTWQETPPGMHTPAQQLDPTPLDFKTTFQNPTKKTLTGESKYLQMKNIGD